MKNVQFVELSKNEMSNVEGGSITLGALTALAGLAGAVYYAGTVVGQYAYDIIN